MVKQLTVQGFFKTFPDDDACLDHLMQLRFGDELECPKCKKNGHFTKIKKIPAYSCPWCGHHIHPRQGTPFERSRTSLQKWFYAIYLFAVSRHGVAAKELQRQLGVTYKTAWRMAHEIRKYMAEIDGDDGLSGHVEVDEAYLGGYKPGIRGPHKSGKTIVFGMLERDGDIITRVVDDTKRKTLFPIIKEKVEEGSTISTDEMTTYHTLSQHGYEHGTVNHNQEQWKNGIHHTNSIEGMWAMLKRSIRGTHIHVSRKHLPKYLGEFEYRWNMRRTPELMFNRLLLSF